MKFSKIISTFLCICIVFSFANTVLAYGGRIYAENWKESDTKTFGIIPNAQGDGNHVVGQAKNNELNNSDFGSVWETEDGLPLGERKALFQLEEDSNTTNDIKKVSSVSIQEKFRQVQEKYPPNQGVKFTGSYGGCTECFGFARIVFYNLFGCDMPAAYYNARRYEYVNTNNVILIGQLEGVTEVTSQNVKALLSQARMGDIIQACGSYHHTMVVVEADDSGIVLYDANGQGDDVIRQTRKSYEEIANGIKMNLYAGYPDLYMQVNKKNTFVYEPNWYKGLDYPKERERGYDSSEDLLVPGYFEMPIKKGETIIFSASIEAGVPAQLPQQMEDEISKAPKYDSFYHCLVNAAHQFDIEKEGMHYILAGYPWFKCRARDTFISLPGLTLSIGEEERFDQYMATAEKAINQYIHKQPIDVQIYEMEQPDTLLWAIWCLQQYAKDTSRQKCYERYGQLIGDIIAFIRDGQHANLVVHENHLLYSNGRNTPITWMNSTANGRPIIPRSGYIVEFNALWYNALRFYALLLTETGSEENRQKAQEYEREAEDVSQSFKKIFLNEYGYLLDYVDGPMMDWSVRPNQIFAIALDFSPLDLKERKKVLDICTKELVTPKGIRSLSPKSGGYTPMYVGPQSQRDQAYHQGTAWPWLTGFYLEAYLRIYKMSGLGYIERQLIGFEEELFYHCIGTIPELFDGNPPFSGRGAISFAMNVSGILRAIRLYERNKIED